MGRKRDESFLAGSKRSPPDLPEPKSSRGKREKKCVIVSQCVSPDLFLAQCASLPARAGDGSERFFERENNFLKSWHQDC